MYDHRGMFYEVTLIYDVRRPAVAEHPLFHNITMRLF
jgi:hypothetical protein